MTPWPANWRSAASHWPRLRRVIFGDRVGLLVFLASLCVFGLVWRTAFLINDSYTLANGLYALERGSVHLTEAAYGPGLETPGANFHDGQVYARNYGVLVLAIPVLWALRAVSLVADLHIALLAGWTLLVLGTLLLGAWLLDRRRAGAVWASVAVLAVFLANVWLATPVPDPPLHLVALQLVHMVIAGFVAVGLYRLVGSLHDTRRGVLAAVLVVGGTPLSFWASVPKRHVVTAAVVLAVALAVHRSRRGPETAALRHRAVAYALVGLLAWVHAPEALIVFVVLVAVDVSTAPPRDARTVGVLGGAFLLSLVPMVLTNAAITGDPLAVPRSLRSVSPGADLSLAGGGGGGSAGRFLPYPLLVVLTLATSGAEPFSQLGVLVSEGGTTVLRHPDRVYHAFVRSGFVDRVARRAADTPAANLSFLEAAPVVGGLLGVAWNAVRTGVERVGTGRVRAGWHTADTFVVLLALVYALVYVSRLPVHAQVTVRYLFPLYPLAVYGLVRSPVVGAALAANWRPFGWAYAAGVLLGGQVLFVVLVGLAVGRAEAFQFHALLGLATAAAVALWSLTAPPDGRIGTAGGVAAGLATAAATTFLAFATLAYFPLGGTHALPMVRALAALVAVG